jgi:poly(3-hydroxybutyrate) depolymerase
MLYALHEAQRPWFRAVSSLSRGAAEALRAVPAGLGGPLAAGWELVHRTTREFPRPSFGITSVHAHGTEVSVSEQVVLETPWCKLVRFARRHEDPAVASALGADPVVLVCAPLSGHFATLLRETVRTLLGEHDVLVTDWSDARDVPLGAGTFGLDDYVEHLERFVRHLGASRTHLVAVCQPAVPALAAVARLAARGEDTPPTLTLMGGPVDPRKSPTEVNRLATSRPLAWFEQNLVHTVPRGHAGEGRKVYPGFLQLGAFVAMNPERHAKSYRDYWLAQLRGDRDAASQHERFYDEFNAVLDMDAPYYLETVRLVFQEFALARGTWQVRGELVRPEAITTTALLTVEGSEDDITGAGQTHAAHTLCSGLSPDARRQLTVQGAGHYGIFSGRRWREVVHPELREFVRAHDPARSKSDTTAGSAGTATAPAGKAEANEGGAR